MAAAQRFNDFPWTRQRKSMMCVAFERVVTDTKREILGTHCMTRRGVHMKAARRGAMRCIQAARARVRRDCTEAYVLGVRECTSFCNLNVCFRMFKVTIEGCERCCLVDMSICAFMSLSKVFEVHVLLKELIVCSMNWRRSQLCESCWNSSL